MPRIATPEVTLLGMTDTVYGALYPMELDVDSDHGEDLMEFSGRSCYQSFHKPNEATRSNKDYLANILKQGHESVLEHVSATFYLTGVSRALTHELIRHRHLSYSQLSQRFVDEKEAAMVVPPALRDDHVAVEILGEAFDYALWTYQELVQTLEHKGLPRKQAREAARAVLPNCTETRIVVTGNVRAWRDFLKKRLDPAADAEIREVAQMIFRDLNLLFPSAFQDFDSE